MKMFFCAWLEIIYFFHKSDHKKKIIKEHCTFFVLIQTATDHSICCKNYMGFYRLKRDLFFIFQS